MQWFRRKNEKIYYSTQGVFSKAIIRFFIKEYIISLENTRKFKLNHSNHNGLISEIYMHFLTLVTKKNIYIGKMLILWMKNKFIRQI